MGIVITIATFAILGFIGWLIYRAVRGKQVKAHHVIYGIAVITGIFTYGFFLSMNILQPVKILLSIILGIVLIILAALLQRRQATKP
ncbi:MAG: hypothetical protein ABH934_01090 [Chloroflexota bacterium]